jgi:hypothetical protein
MQKKSERQIAINLLQYASTTLSLLWLAFLPLSLGLKPVFLYIFAAFSFICCGVSYLLAFNSRRMHTALMLGTFLILVAGSLSAPEAHKTLHAESTTAYWLLILLDGLVLTLIILVSATHAPALLKNSWSSLCRRYEEISRKD